MSDVITSVREVEDMAAKHGPELQASRFPGTDVGMEDSGLAYHAVKPGRQQPFGHRHKTAEEIHVILSGFWSGSSSTTSSRRLKRRT